MVDDRASLYACFLAGEEGTCTVCGMSGCHAFASDEEIDATYGSRFDSLHFVWIGSRHEICNGFICDPCIDELVRTRRTEAFQSDMSGPLPGLSQDAAAAAYQLGARRIQAILRLPEEPDGQLSADALDALLLSLRGRGRPLPSSAWERVERMIPHKTGTDDPESSGRRRALARAATGLVDDPDLERDARTWATARSARRKRDAETDRIVQAMET